MCLAIFKKTGLSIPYDSIKAAWRMNGDGAGIAIRGTNFVEIHKGFMSLGEFIDFLTLNEKTFNNYDMVLHLRYTTSGNTNIGMTHPFPVSRKNADLVSPYFKTDKAVIHNGVMFNPNLSCHGYSDTAIFAKWLAVFNPKMKKIKKVLGEDRLAIVTKEKVELLGDWHEKDGIMYSNLYSLASYSYSKWDDDYEFSKRWGSTAHGYADDHHAVDTLEELDYCVNCGSDNTEYIGVYTMTMECLTCHSVYNVEQFMETYDLNDMGLKAVERRSQKKNVPGHSLPNEVMTAKNGNRYGT